MDSRLFVDLQAQFMANVMCFLCQIFVLAELICRKKCPQVQITGCPMDSFGDEKTADEAAATALFSQLDRTAGCVLPSSRNI